MTTDRNDIDLKLKADRKKYLTRIASLALINTTLFTLLTKGMSFQFKLTNSLIATTLSFTMLGFILGTIFATFPYKGLGYGKKYLRASLLCILTLQFIMAGGLVLIGIMKLFGRY